MFFSLIFYFISPLLPYIYLGHADNLLIQYLALSVGVIAFDGVAQSFISALRVYGISQIPPLFRLSLICIGITLSFYFVTDNDPIANIIKFMMIGNILASIFCILYFIKNFSYIKKLRLIKQRYFLLIIRFLCSFSLAPISHYQAYRSISTNIEKKASPTFSAFAYGFSIISDINNALLRRYKSYSIPV